MQRSTPILPGKLFLLVLLAAFGGLFVQGCKKSGSGQPASIYATIAADPDYSLLTAAVTKAGLKDALDKKSQGGLTLFAPNNKAFIAAGIKNAGDLAGIPDSTLSALLLYHVVGSTILAAQIPQAANTPVASLNGQPLYVTKTAAGKVFVDGSSVTRADIMCTNGVIHAIDHVLMPAVGTIVQTAQGNPNLSLLVTAVLRASQGSTNVASVLSSAGPFTVFAPTNQAFVNAGFPDAQAINNADPNTLTSILTYHVIAGRIFSSDLVDKSMPATVNGETVTILLSAGAQVKGKGNTSASNIIAANIVATNGVVHVIDQVLLP